MAHTVDLFKSVQTFMVNILIVLLTALIVLLLPVFLLTVFLPMFLYRLLLHKCSRILRPDLGKMLTTISSSFVAKLPFVYDQPKNTLLVYGVLEGHMDLQEFRRTFHVLLDSKNAKGNLLYPEMKQYITTWGGFYFWKPEENFRVESHIRFLDDKLIPESCDQLDGKSVVKVAQSLIKRPFPREQSPWEFVLLHNREKNQNGSTLEKKTVAMIRFHHSLADGYSMFNLVLKHARCEVVQAKPKFQGRGRSCRQILNSILFPIRMPYEMLWQFFHCYDRNQWHLSEKRMARDNCGIVSRTIPTGFVRRIKAAHESSFAGVLLTALAGGIRKSMEENGAKMPNQIHCLTPLPLPNHPQKLRNYMTGCFVKLKIHISDSQERLKAVEENLLEIRNSTMLQTNFVLNKIIGGTVNFLAERLWKPVLCTVTLSSFPGPEQELTYLGQRMLRAGFLGNIDVGNLGLTVTLFSYAGNLEICLGVDKNILGAEKQTQALMDNILGELDDLASKCIV